MVVAVACKFFGTASGCRNGEKCRFEHAPAQWRLDFIQAMLQQIGPAPVEPVWARQAEWAKRARENGWEHAAPPEPAPELWDKRGKWDSWSNSEPARGDSWSHSSPATGHAGQHDKRGWGNNSWSKSSPATGHAGQHAGWGKCDWWSENSSATAEAWQQDKWGNSDSSAKASDEPQPARRRSEKLQAPPSSEPSLAFKAAIVRRDLDVKQDEHEAGRPRPRLCDDLVPTSPTMMPKPPTRPPPEPPEPPSPPTPPKKMQRQWPKPPWSEKVADAVAHYAKVGAAAAEESSPSSSTLPAPAAAPAAAAAPATRSKAAPHKNSALHHLNVLFEGHSDGSCSPSSSNELPPHSSSTSRRIPEEQHLDDLPPQQQHLTAAPQSREHFMAKIDKLKEANRQHEEEVKNREQLKKVEASRDRLHGWYQSKAAKSRIDDWQ